MSLCQTNEMSLHVPGDQLSCSKSTKAGREPAAGLCQPPRGPPTGSTGAARLVPHPYRVMDALSGPQPRGARSPSWLGARRGPRTEQRPGSAPSGQGIDPRQGMQGGCPLPCLRADCSRPTGAVGGGGWASLNLGSQPWAPSLEAEGRADFWGGLCLPRLTFSAFSFLTCTTKTTGHWAQKVCPKA